MRKGSCDYWGIFDQAALARWQSGRTACAKGGGRMTDHPDFTSNTRGEDLFRSFLEPGEFARHLTETPSFCRTVYAKNY